MPITDFILEHKGEIIKSWRRLAVETYPRQTAMFLEREKDPFANPVGSALEKLIHAVFNEITGQINKDGFISELDYFIKIRAVQEFSPSEAVIFIFYLKKALFDVVKSRKFELSLDDILELDSKIDAIALICFDKYMESRDKVHSLRAMEIEKRSYRQNR